MNFSTRLKELRKEMKLTQEEFGKMINKTRSTIAGYETERKQPDYETLISIANIFDISVDYLLGRTDIRNPYKNCNKSIDKEAKLYKNIDVTDLPEEAIKQIEEYVEFMRQKHNVNKVIKRTDE